MMARTTKRSRSRKPSKASSWSKQAASSGSYAARNAGLARSTGTYIAITDAGCVPSPDWIARGTEPLRDDAMTVVAGRIAMPLGPRPSLAAMVDVVHHLDQRAYVEDQGAAVTANLLTTAEVFRRAGRFDGVLASGGDREWVKRACDSGADLRYSHDAVVVHPPRTLARQLLRKSARVARGGSVARAGGGRQAPASGAAYRSPWTLIPRNRRRGLERVRENGARPGRVRWLAVAAAQLAFVQIPQAVAALYWDLRLWSPRGRRTG